VAGYVNVPYRSSVDVILDPTAPVIKGICGYFIVIFSVTRTRNAGQYPVQEVASTRQQSHPDVAANVLLFWGLQYLDRAWEWMNQTWFKSIKGRGEGRKHNLRHRCGKDSQVNHAQQFRNLPCA
jgi:hypothetical protein